jgi:hypothetical protein
MPSWITKEMRLQMTAIAREDEALLEGILKKTSGRGTEVLNSLEDDELFILYCHFQNYPEIADHFGISRTTASQYYNDRGFKVEDLRSKVLSWIDETEDYEFDTDVFARSTVERLEAQVDYFRKRYEREKADNDKLKNGYNLWRDIVTEVVAEFPEVPPAYPTTLPKGNNDEELVILPISDTQIGSCVLPEKMGGLEAYNWDVFLHRIEEYKRGVDSIVNKHQRLSQPIRTAVVMLLGDLVEGEDIYPNQLANLDLSLTKQVFDGALKIAELIRWIASQFENVRVFAVPGNHGSTRTTTVNMDYVAYMMMATALAEQSNLEFFISETHYMGLHIDRNQDYLDFGECDRVWNFLLTHGNQAKSYVGLPFYSLEKMVRRYSSMTGILWDKMFVGHHHQDVPGPKNAWAVNGSWVGGTEYSQEKMQGSDQPCQRIWGFHPKRGLTWTYPIDLDDATRLEMRPNDQGIYTPYTTVDAADSGGFEFSLHGVEV